MKLKIIRTLYENGDVSYETNDDHAPYSKIVIEHEQEIEIDPNKFVECAK